MQQIAAEPVDHDDRRLGAAGVGVMDALAVDVHELAARRQHGFDARGRVGREPDEAGDDDREQQDQSEKECHEKPSRGD